MPWFNELVHLPMFMWDPRTAEKDTRRGALAQTIDIAPTMLRYFGLEPTPDMQGEDLGLVLDEDTSMRTGALFGAHGGHVNVTDGRYVYMRASADATNQPLEDYTLMPTHMRSRFAVNELADWVPADPLPFTKGIRTMRIPVASTFMNPWLHGTLLFDLASDPGQEHPLVDDVIELRMLRLLQELMHANHAPRSQFDRLGMPFDNDATEEHLHAASHRDRAALTAAPLPPLSQFHAPELITAPVLQLAQSPFARSVLERHVPLLLRTELVAFMPQLNLYDLARTGLIQTVQLIDIDQEFLVSATSAT
jgi:hypothetical protein